MAKYKAINIKYDTDGEEVDLPTVIEVDVPNEITDYFEIEEFISDKISDETGFCHEGFNIDPELPQD